MNYADDIRYSEAAAENVLACLRPHVTRIVEADGTVRAWITGQLRTCATSFWIEYVPEPERVECGAV